MKNKYILGIALVAIMVLSVVALVPGALANPKDSSGEKIPGHLAYKINFIGAPKDQGDTSFSPGAEDGNGRRIFIPLVTTWVNEGDVSPCDATNPEPGDKIAILEMPTGGVKIFVSDGPFDVIDGNAVDGEASFQMPANEYDVYIAAKGKPNQCLDLAAYVTQGSTLYYLGTIDVDRTTKRPKWKNINKLFYESGNPKGISYLSDGYQDYTWKLYNDGLRNMEVRFYIQEPAP